MTFFETLRLFWENLQQGQVLPLGIWSYFLLMVLIIIQGPISTMLGGAAASVGLLSPVGVFCVAVVGNLGADAFWYSMGYSSKIVWSWPFLRRYRIVVDFLTKEMHRHTIKVLLMGKLSVGMAVPAVIAAGIAQIPWRRFFPIVMVGELVWTGSFLLIGYYGTESLKGSEGAVVWFGVFVSVVFLGVAAVYLLRKFQKQNQAD